MRVLALTVVALICFAANSVLTRAALVGGDTGPGVFTALRLLSGALALGGLAALSGRLRALEPRRVTVSGLWLFLYAAAFSYAYVSLDSGVGALLLFGAVQVTMFAGALAGGERISLARWLGAASAMTGLAALTAPGATAPPLVAAGLMAVSGVAWGVYSLRGRSAADAMATTGAAFLVAAPLGLALWLGFGAGEPVSMRGAALALASGALASGGGYAVWYAVLPKLDATLAAIAMLTVPLIAFAGGVVFLAEPATLRFALASVLILGGLAAATLVGGRR